MAAVEPCRAVLAAARRSGTRGAGRIEAVAALPAAREDDGSSRVGRKETMLKTRNPAAVAPPAAMYSHSVEVPPNARWLFTAGQVGVRPDGSVPDTFEEQHDQIWQNTLAILADAGMGPENIVRLNVYSTDPEGLKYVRPHREQYLEPHHTRA